MRGEKYEQEQRDQVYIIAHFHHIVAAREQEFVHDGSEEPKQAIRVHETGQFEGVETQVVIGFSNQTGEYREEIEDEITAI